MSGAVYYAGIAMILAYLIYKYLKTTSMSEKMIYRRGINIAAVFPLGIAIIAFYLIIFPATFYFAAKVMKLSNVEEDLKLGEDDIKMEDERAADKNIIKPFKPTIV